MSADRLAAALADRYRIERELGAGGMATVYLAQDLKHDRQVAIKVLKPDLAAVLGAERFIAEIKTTAALSHPHILPLFDSGEAGGFLYYVMPYLQGETIREKLNRETQFSIDEAVKITTEVAEALDYAHQHGVIHRDIKPENILLHAGRPMVMDFGIALAVSAAAGGRMTETGLSLGTPHYMSPEQATADKQITGRSDIYSLASVCYEMLAGEPPHGGGSAQAIIMKIIAESARPVSDLRKSVPPHVTEALAKALEKVPADRFATAAEFSAAIQGRVVLTGPTRARTTARLASRSLREVTLAALAVGGLGLALWAFATRSPDVAGGGSVEFALRLGQRYPDRPMIAISRDGRRIAGIVSDSTPDGQIAVRELGSTRVTLLAGTAGARSPDFSPDGRWLLYANRRGLFVMPSSGGPSTKLADSVAASGTAWIDARRFVFTRIFDGLFQASMDGETPRRLTTLDSTRREFIHWSPQVLPGGKTAIFSSYTTPAASSRIEAVDLTSGHRTVLVEGAIKGRYAPSGHLLFVRDGTLYATRFDAGRLEVSGTAVPVLEDLAWDLTDGAAGYDLADNGTLVYLMRSEWRRTGRMAWVDRTGQERPAVEDAGQWAEPRISPDGRWIAATRLEEGRQIWLYDRARRVQSRLSRTDGVAFNPVWTPDSRSVVASVETPTYDLWRLAIDGIRQDTLVVSSADKYASSLSPDGRTLLYTSAAGRDRVNLLALGADTRPARSWEAAASRRNAVFAPDGRWIAFEEMTPAGDYEVFVTAAEGDGNAGRRQVSAAGGTEPRWTRAGRELVYRKGGAVMVASFTPATGEPGTPVLLFSKADQGRLSDDRTLGYDVTPDGAEFLMVIPVERPDALPVVVILNWMQQLDQRIPR